MAQVAHEFSQQSFGLNVITRGSLLRALNAYQHTADIFGGSPAKVFNSAPSRLPGLPVHPEWLELRGPGYCPSILPVSEPPLEPCFRRESKGSRLRTGLGRKDFAGRAGACSLVGVYKLFESGVPAFDVVTCNHALAEMHPNSMAFALRVAREMLRGKGLKAFVFEGWGFERFVPRSTITKEFHRCGFNLVHNDEQITVFAPRESDCASPCTRLPRFGFSQGVRSGQPGDMPSRAPRPGKFARSVTAFKEVLGSQIFCMV